MSEDGREPERVRDPDQSLPAPGMAGGETSNDEPSAEPEEAPVAAKRPRDPDQSLPAPGDKDKELETGRPAPIVDESIPGFATHYPKHPRLTALLAAFEAGNYALVRREAERLAAETDREDVRRAARDLRRRIDPDPLVVYLLIAAIALLGMLAFYYWTYRHDAP